MIEFEQPTMNCPRCHKEYPDFDGLGVVYCPKPEGCGYCRHLSRSGTNGKCEFCGQLKTPKPGETPLGSIW